MKTLPPGLSTHLDGRAYSICRAFTVTRKDGGVVRFAEVQSALTVSGQTFQPAKGIRVSSIPFQINPSNRANAFDIEFTAESAGLIDPDDLVTGRYANAEIVVSLVNYVDPSAGLFTYRRGVFGEISRKDSGLIKVQALGILSKAQEVPIEHYEPLCRTYLGTTRCGIALGPLTKTSTVVSSSGYNVVVSGVTSDRPLALGQIAPTSGPWYGNAFEIRAWDEASQTITLFLPVASLLTVGTPVSISPGCDFTIAMCRDTYANAVNFQAEPDIPGEDALSIVYKDWGV